MRWVDLGVIVLYLVGITWFGAQFRESQKTLKDYFLGGTTAPWWAIALSIVSAETSTLTVIGTPALSFQGNLGIPASRVRIPVGPHRHREPFPARIFPGRDVHRLRTDAPPLRQPHPPLDRRDVFGAPSAGRRRAGVCHLYRDLDYSRHRRNNLHCRYRLPDAVVHVRRRHDRRHLDGRRADGPVRHRRGSQLLHRPARNSGRLGARCLRRRAGQVSGVRFPARAAVDFFHPHL